MLRDDVRKKYNFDPPGHARRRQVTPLGRDLDMITKTPLDIF